MTCSILLQSYIKNSLKVTLLVTVFCEQFLLWCLFALVLICLKRRISLSWLGRWCALIYWFPEKLVTFSAVAAVTLPNLTIRRCQEPPANWEVWPSDFTTRSARSVRPPGRPPRLTFSPVRRARNRSCGRPDPPASSAHSLSQHHRGQHRELGARCWVQRDGVDT